MKKKIKKKGLKKTIKDLRRYIKRLGQEKEKLIYELVELDEIKKEKEDDNLKKNFEEHFSFIKKLVGKKKGGII